jgi:hypothetical protein
MLFGLFCLTITLLWFSGSVSVSQDKRPSGYPVGNAYSARYATRLWFFHMHTCPYIRDLPGVVIGFVIAYRVGSG